VTTSPARRATRRLAALGGAAAVLVAGGCTQEVVTPGAAVSTTVPPERTAVVGEEVTSGGVELIVLDVTATDRSPDGVPRVRAVVRTENVDDVERQNPAVTLRCAETTADGDWFRGSTWEPGQLLPPGAVSEGVVLLGFPPKDGAPLYSVATCTDAHLEVELGGPGEQHVHVRYDVSADVVTESIERPRGKVLPLPLETR